MFVLSVKTSKKQIVSMIACVVMLITVILVAIFWPSDGGVSASVSVAAKGGSDSDRIAFLERLGYEVESEPLSVKEVLIPDEFDEVFEQYNTIQKDAGMDFTPYHGKRTKVWTYRVCNMPGDVQASLYVYNGKIIGGDIHSTALDGFMHGLIKNSDNKAVEQGEQSAG